MEQDKDAATALEFDHRLQGMKVDVLKFKRNFANMPSWEMLEREIEKSNLETANYIKTSQSNLLDKLNRENGLNLGKLEEWFSEHDSMAKKRQERVDKAVKSCARTNELEELRENLESDGEVMKRRVAAASQKLQEAVLNMQTMKEKQALQKLNAHFTGYMKKLTGGAFYKWKGMNDEVNDLIEMEKHRTAKMKRVLAMIFYRTLKLAMALWQKHTVLLVKYLAEKKRAGLLMNKSMTKMMLSRIDAGFKHWHRNTMYYREAEVRNKAKTDMERARRKSLVQGKAFTLTTASGLGDIMSSFKNDTKGAIDVITRELNALRFEEIAGLRRDWELEKVRNEFDSKNTLQSSLDQIGARADEFEKSIGNKLGAMQEMMPKMRTELSTQGRKVEGLEKDAKKMNAQVTKNTSSIDSIVETLGRNETRMFEVEDKVQGVKGDVGKLQEGERRALGLIEDLTHKLSDAEEREEKLKQQLADTVSYFEAEMRGLRDMVLGTKEKTKYVEEALGRERDYLRKFEESTVEDTTDLRRIVEFNGVLKPKMELMVNACLPYEQLSHEKKYCPPINSPALDMYIPDAIAAFSVNMAAWIAFKADHEAMSRVVSGVNPEEIVYADEDIEFRRRSLIEEVRFEFRRAVEKGNPDAGALRLEARHKFQARLIDSVDSALSKHDQVLIMGSSRASRVKAAVPACVACDRPLRTKARKGKLMEEEGAGANNNNNGPEEPQVNDKLKGREGMPGYGARRPQSADPRLRRDPSSGGYVGGRSGGGGGDLQPVANSGVAGAVGSAGAPYVLRSGFKMPRAKPQLTPMADTQRRPYSPEERIGELTNTINYGERE
ncbi:hypothetical protein TL16_g12635 [Triparma laevis f. inornata]|uniref:Uncharacterized protein n=1 Tax=Triparma laevis f. inornata TaxID=1714386 RepID=A0A9W7EXI4_9STRA|nr:hypothetical protein TL16_g12635 [Triparma laevis f. inornata]